MHMCRVWRRSAGMWRRRFLTGGGCVISSRSVPTGTEKRPDPAYTRTPWCSDRTHPNAPVHVMNTLCYTIRAAQKRPCAFASLVVLYGAPRVAAAWLGLARITATSFLSCECSMQCVPATAPRSFGESLARCSQCATCSLLLLGAAYCQFMDLLFPGELRCSLFMSNQSYRIVCKQHVLFFCAIGPTVR